MPALLVLTVRVLNIQFWISGREAGCGRDLSEVNMQVTSKLQMKTSAQGTGMEYSWDQGKLRNRVMLSIQGWRRKAAKDTWQETHEADGRKIT